MKRSAIRAGIALLASAWLAAAAHADEAGASALSGNVTVQNDYLFRGISQTAHHPAVQAGLEYGAEAGGYVGAWASNVSWLADTSSAAQPVSSSLEFDAYAGWRGKLGGGWHWDAGLYAYAYPGSYPRGYTSPQTLEGYLVLGWQTLSLKYAPSFTNLFGVADSRGSSYLELSWHQPLTATWQLAAHLGRQRVAGHGAASYDDWKLGVSHDLGQGWSLALDWHDTNARRAVYTNAQGQYLGRATWLVGVAKGF